MRVLVSVRDALEAREATKDERVHIIDAKEPSRGALALTASF